jgi:hypothetical protein
VLPHIRACASGPRDPRKSVSTSRVSFEDVGIVVASSVTKAPSVAKSGSEPRNRRMSSQAASDVMFMASETYLPIAWMRTMLFDYRWPTHGYAATRESAMPHGRHVAYYRDDLPAFFWRPMMHGCLALALSAPTTATLRFDVFRLFRARFLSAVTRTSTTSRGLVTVEEGSPYIARTSHYSVERVLRSHSKSFAHLTGNRRPPADRRIRPRHCKQVANPTNLPQVLYHFAEWKHLGSEVIDVIHEVPREI